MSKIALKEVTLQKLLREGDGKAVSARPFENRGGSKAHEATEEHPVRIKPNN